MASLKQKVEAQDHGTYKLEVRARKAFRDLRHHNYVQMAEVFTEIYVASFRTDHSEGWFFKTHDWWEDKHGLGRGVVDTAREKLRGLGIVEERHWVGNRVEYRLIPARVIEVLYPEGAEEGSGLREIFKRGHPGRHRRTTTTPCWPR